MTTSKNSTSSDSSDSVPAGDPVASEKTAKKTDSHFWDRSDAARLFLDFSGRDLLRLKGLVPPDYMLVVGRHETPQGELGEWLVLAIHKFEGLTAAQCTEEGRVCTNHARLLSPVNGVWDTGPAHQHEATGVWLWSDN